MEDISVSIKKLACYAREKGLISQEEVSYSINLLLDVLDLDGYEEPKEEFHDVDLESTLKELLDFAAEKGLLKENSVVYRDLFDTKIMNCFLPRPDSVNAEFAARLKKSPKEATDWFYQFSKDSDYIRDYRVKKDLRWQVTTVYGDLDITINLSKPEKDPKAIAAAKLLKQSSYPLCQLCKENMGYRGRVNHPARETIRIIPLQLNGDNFYLQYSPYSYYNEHCIVFNSEHVPMVIDEKALRHLIAFVDRFPHYLLGSNADLPIVGGSILTHDHYQGGNYIFPMFRAEIVKELSFAGFPDVKAYYLKWPLSVIRLASKQQESLIELAVKILKCWRSYSDSNAFIYAETDGVPHNTISPICHKVGDDFVMELALRNNITTEAYPLGVYHPHQEYWNIKKENIGLIEVMGLAILPSRLKKELGALSEHFLHQEDPLADPLTEKHAAWFADVQRKHPEMNGDNISEILRQEVGLTFMGVLECAGVYKQNEEGLRGLLRFVEAVNRL